jgi:hypothetical protein
VVGAIDRRVKCVVSQAPVVSAHANFRALVRADFIAGFQAGFNADREARFRGEPPAMVPVVDEDPFAPSALPTPDSYKWVTETHESRAPSWRNETTLRSVEMFSEYEQYLSAVDQPHAAADDARGRRRPHADRHRDRRLREGPRAQEARDPARRSLRRLRRRLRRRWAGSGRLVHPAPPPAPGGAASTGRSPSSPAQARASDARSRAPSHEKAPRSS